MRSLLYGIILSHVWFLSWSFSHDLSPLFDISLSCHLSWALLIVQSILHSLSPSLSWSHSWSLCLSSNINLSQDLFHNLSCNLYFIIFLTWSLPFLTISLFIISCNLFQSIWTPLLWAFTSPNRNIYLMISAMTSLSLSWYHSVVTCTIFVTHDLSWAISLTIFLFPVISLVWFLLCNLCLSQYLSLSYFSKLCDLFPYLNF